MAHQKKLSLLRLHFRFSADTKRIKLTRRTERTGRLFSYAHRNTSDSETMHLTTLKLQNEHWENKRIRRVRRCWRTWRARQIGRTTRESYTRVWVAHVAHDSCSYKTWSNEQWMFVKRTCVSLLNIIFCLHRTFFRRMEKCPDCKMLRR